MEHHMKDWIYCFTKGQGLGGEKTGWYLLPEPGPLKVPIVRGYEKNRRVPYYFSLQQIRSHCLERFTMHENFIHLSFLSLLEVRALSHVLSACPWTVTTTETSQFDAISSFEVAFSSYLPRIEVNYGHFNSSSLVSIAVNDQPTYKQFPAYPHRTVLRSNQPLSLVHTLLLISPIQPIPVSAPVLLTQVRSLS